MLKSAAARLFLKLLRRCCNTTTNRCFHSIFCPPVLPQVLPPTFLQLIGLLLMAAALPPTSSTMIQSEPRSFDAAPCQTNIPGDCNPYSCHGTCEGRYVRFWDSRLKIDRTVKSCQCVQEPICSLIGMNAYAGCRTYTMLSTTAQRSIRLWTMSEAEKTNHRSRALLAFRSERYWDRLRHKQLLNANSRFCCWTAKSSTLDAHTLRCTPFSIFMPILYALIL